MIHVHFTFHHLHKYFNIPHLHFIFHVTRTYHTTDVSRITKHVTLWGANSETYYMSKETKCMSKENYHEENYVENYRELLQKRPIVNISPRPTR